MYSVAFVCVLPVIAAIMTVGLWLLPISLEMISTGLVLPVITKNITATLIFTKIAHLLFQRIADTILSAENKYHGFGKKGVAVTMNKERIKVYTCSTHHQ